MGEVKIGESNACSVWTLRSAIPTSSSSIPKLGFGIGAPRLPFSFSVNRTSNGVDMDKRSGVAGMTGGTNAEGRSVFLSTLAFSFFGLRSSSWTLVFLGGAIGGKTEAEDEEEEDDEVAVTVPVVVVVVVVVFVAASVLLATSNDLFFSFLSFSPFRSRATINANCSGGMGTTPGG